MDFTGIETNALREEIFALAARLGKLKQELARRQREQQKQRESVFEEALRRLIRGKDSERPGYPVPPPNTSFRYPHPYELPPDCHQQP